MKKAAMDNNHGMGDERDEVARLQRARINRVAAEPNDGDRLTNS